MLCEGADAVRCGDAGLLRRAVLGILDAEVSEGRTVVEASPLKVGEVA